MHVKCAVGRFAEIKAQIELTAQRRHGQGLQAQRSLIVRGPGRVIQRHEHVEERVAGRIALQAQGLQNFLERIALDDQRFLKNLLHRAHQLGKAVLRDQGGTDGQGIDEQADHVLDLLQLAIGRRAADDHVVLPGVAVHEGLDQSQQHRKKRHAQLRGIAL